jgi:hypothetical protein
MKPVKNKGRTIMKHYAVKCCFTGKTVDTISAKNEFNAQVLKRDIEAVLDLETYLVPISADEIADTYQVALDFDDLADAA